MAVLNVVVRIFLWTTLKLLKRNLRFYFLRRSLLGDATDQTIRVLGMGLPMNYLTFNSGEPVFDWTVPKEWVLKSASLKSPSGDVVVDANDSVLNVVNYSTPFSGKLSLEQLLDHLHSIEDKPTAVPYVTSYYAPSWGFCLPHITKCNLEKGLSSRDEF